MGGEAHRHGSEEDLAFFGRIGAGVSHDMRNVLSVIGEYAGLLADLLALAEQGKPLDNAKLKKLSTNITGQVKKGTAAMARFSRFAHAADKHRASIDVTALTENAAALAQRYVALAGCTLQTELPDKAIHINTNPFRLQRVVFSAIELVQQSLESGGRITVTLDDRLRAAVITISGGAPAARERPDRIPQLAAALEELNASIEVSSPDANPSLILSFPKE